MLLGAKTIIHRWLVVIMLCGLFGVFSIAFLDRPIANFFQSYSSRYPQSLLTLALHVMSHALDAMFVVVPLGFIGIIWFGLAAKRRVVLTKLELAWALAGFSVCGSLLVNEFVLKPLFGRYTPSDYFMQHSHYGFVLFGGNLNSSFPSGQAVLIVSFLSVFWIFFPWLRGLWLALILATLAALLAVGWHFMSDLAAGGIVGMTGGMLAVKFGRTGGLRS